LLFILKATALLPDGRGMLLGRTLSFLLVNFGVFELRMDGQRVMRTWWKKELHTCFFNRTC
jgi:hypothetical protein